jgi:predicted ATPase
MMKIQTELTEIRKGMVEEFAEIERKLAEELKSSGTQNISSEEFLNLKKKLSTANQLVSALEKQGDQKKTLQDQLLVELQHLNELWLAEFNLIKEELDKVGASGSSISITSGYKEDKTDLIAFMKDIFRGSGIRETTYQGIAEEYVDFIAIYKDFSNAKNMFGSNPQILSDLIMQNLKSLLTYQTPNKFTIVYRGKELQHHSLGQRASALILFVLSQKENDVIIIDQPEDDLDNQTIYEDVIKLIRQMKQEVQFIFATHNPNIPVLGDAELVHACSFTDFAETVYSGSVDNHETQKRIVSIMEGGKEAFDRRKEIYQIWKP